MARDDWLVGGGRREVAADRIYAAATELVVRYGFDVFDIDALAARMHCSRATIYRYAGGKKEIRDAVVLRLAAGVVDAVRKSVDGLSGPERVVTAITVALEQIRARPIRTVISGTRGSPDLADMHGSPLLSQLAADLAGITDDDPQAAQWVVRVVMSFAHWPQPDQRVEQETIRRFVAPAFEACP